MDRSISQTEADEKATHFELACRAAGIGIWELHVEEDRLVYSELARSIFGFPQAGPITREMVYDAIHPDDRELVHAAARRATDPATRADEHYVYRIRRFDSGDLRWLRGHGIARFTGEGSQARAVLYAGSVRDITEQELTRQALVASEERLRLAVDAADMAVWDLDMEAGVVAHSPELNRMLGFPEAAQPSLEEFRSRYAPGERERLEAEGAAARARGETTLQTRVRYILPERGEVTYVLRAALAETQLLKGGAQRVIGVLFDATEQAQAEERLITLSAELRHRLKNMASLAGIFARQTWSRDPRLDSFMGRIRALTMSADLMFGSRNEDLRLHDLVARSLQPFRNKDRDPFDVSGPEQSLPDAVFTGVALALHELATNAVKHGALSIPEGRVSLTWRIEADVLRIAWHEIGGPPVREPEREGFGLSLLRKAALPPPHAVDLDFRVEGLIATIRARLEV